MCKFHHSRYSFKFSSLCSSCQFSVSLWISHVAQCYLDTGTGWHLHSYSRLTGSSIGRGDSKLPKEGEKKDNQMMMSVLWQRGTAWWRHHRSGQNKKEEEGVGEGLRGQGGGSARVFHYTTWDKHITRRAWRRKKANVKLNNVFIIQHWL